MSRILQPVTIIPSELYVERAADRQLRSIVEGMGRPGYVLVARQMGKTNLLLNARRTLERPDFLFVYVDLSARLDSLEQYFALLLNTAHAVHPQLFDSLVTSNFPRDNYSAATFDGILRSVLKHYRGKLVFILDEIDSLANYSFSDRVFSHIRSMYFSRTNFPDYGRVTYILSGVAEPSELIKDKNVSPFNIGQKIFLNDFSEQEFAFFLQKARLSISREVADRIFYWAGGNPRITWEICSEVEALLEARAATASDVDEITSNLYITTFDRAPVDHIRTLAQTDRDIRAAIKSLRSGHVSEISDKVRSKLYLAGITSMQSEGAGGAILKIKNKVVDFALSERWLHDVEKQSRSNLQLARENYEEKLHEPAVAFFEEYLQDHEIEPGNIDAYRLAVSYFSTRRYERAIDWLAAYAELSDSVEIRSDAFYMVGRSHLALGRFDAAAEAFRTVVQLGSTPLVPMAKGLLASSLIQLDPSANAAEVRELCESSLQLSENLKADQAANARVVSLLNLAAVEEVEGRKSAALQLIERAESENSPAYRPIIILNALKLVDDDDKKNRMLDELTDCLMSVASAPQDQRLDGSWDAIFISALVALRLDGKRTDFDRLLEFYLGSKEGAPLSVPSLYVALYNAAAKVDKANARVFLSEVIEQFGDQADAVLEASRTLVLFQSDTSVASDYLSALAKTSSADSGITEADHFAIAIVVGSALRAGDIDALARVDSVPHAVELEGDETTMGELYHASYEIARLERLGRIPAALKLSRKLVRILLANSRSARRFGDDTRRSIIALAQAVIERYSGLEEEGQMELKKYARNAKVTVLYSDGKRVTSKFKLVQRDIVLGKCQIITEADEGADLGIRD